MLIRDLLTNESLRGLFSNNFELTNFAIRLGRYYVRAGHEITLAHLLDQVKKNPSEKFLQELAHLENE